MPSDCQDLAFVWPGAAGPVLVDPQLCMPDLTALLCLGPWLVQVGNGSLRLGQPCQLTLAQLDPDLARRGLIPDLTGPWT